MSNPGRNGLLRKDRRNDEEWRHNTEFMLNLPETEGIAKLYEVRRRKRKMFFFWSTFESKAKGVLFFLNEF